jgi:hypothetical protein
MRWSTTAIRNSSPGRQAPRSRTFLCRFRIRARATHVVSNHPSPRSCSSPGNIASGKSTLANQLHAALGGRLYQRGCDRQPLPGPLLLRHASLELSCRPEVPGGMGTGSLSAVHPAGSIVAVDRCHLEGGVFAGLAAARVSSTPRSMRPTRCCSTSCTRCLPNPQH